MGFGKPVNMIFWAKCSLTIVSISSYSNKLHDFFNATLVLFVYGVAMQAYNYIKSSEY